MALFGSGIWGWLVILGPIVLGAAIIWAMMHNRQTPQQEERTEEATHELYEEQDAQDKAAGDQ